jgi:hypothetical protein
MMTVKAYLLSLPERLVRSAVGLSAGVFREVGDLAIPEAIRRGRLYRNLVDTTLRFLIEEVGGVEGTYPTEEKLAGDFLARRTAGNALELLGIVAFRASPVWVLAALADLCGAGRHMIPEIADALKAEGLLEKDSEFATVDQMLDGLERSSARLATNVNAPPLDVATLRQEWRALRGEIGSIAPGSLPSRETLAELWTELKSESTRQNRSVFEVSSMLAVSAASALPDKLWWLSSSAKTAASRTGQVVAAALLDHYRQTLSDIRAVGFIKYTSRQLRPYLRAALVQFSPERRTITQRLVEKWKKPDRDRALRMRE